MTHSFTVITWFTHFGTQLPNRLCQKVHTSARSLRAFSWRAGNLWVNQHWPFLWQRTEIKMGKTIAKWVSFPKIFLKKLKNHPLETRLWAQCGWMGHQHIQFSFEQVGFSLWVVHQKRGEDPLVLPCLPSACEWGSLVWGCRLGSDAPRSWVGTARFQSQPHGAGCVC